MDIDFHEQYKNYSTVDLLKITMRPESYQPAAIIAATALLERRVVTQAEKDEVENIFRVSETAVQPKKLLLPGIKGTSSTSDKWVSAILLIAILEYLRVLYNDINVWSSVLHNKNLPFRSVFIGSYIDLLYLPIIFYMFYRRKRWGWIVMFVSKLFTIMPTLTYYFHDYSGSSIFPFFLFGIFLNAAMVVLLWRQDIRHVFNIDKRTGKLTVFATVILSAIWLIRFWGWPF